MKRTHCIPGATLLGIAFILSLLVRPLYCLIISGSLFSSPEQTALSLPYVREFDIARVSFQGNTAKASSGDAREARVSAPRLAPRNRR